MHCNTWNAILVIRGLIIMIHAVVFQEKINDMIKLRE
jgi:hypothetical protein